MRLEHLLSGAAAAESGVAGQGALRAGEGNEENNGTATRKRRVLSQPIHSGQGRPRGTGERQSRLTKSFSSVG